MTILIRQKKTLKLNYSSTCSKTFSEKTSWSFAISTTCPSIFLLVNYDSDILWMILLTGWITYFLYLAISLILTYSPSFVRTPSLKGNEKQRHTLSVYPPISVNEKIIGKTISRWNHNKMRMPIEPYTSM